MHLLELNDVMKWLDGGRARLRLLFARAAESRMNSEFQFHIDMEIEQLVRTKGLSSREARRQALAQFGGVEKHKEALRDGRGLRWLKPLSLDVKLGGRMLLKYPGLTLAGGLALAMAIGIGAGWHHLSRQILHPLLPLSDGDRLVEIDMHDARANVREQRLLHDFLSWRGQLSTIEDLGAYRTLERNLIRGEVPPEPITAAEVTASAFRIARVPPLVGRALLDADEQPGAPPVAVIGYRMWQRRFSGRADIVGQIIQLGRGTTTIVGVMPEGFAFPVNHELWVPLQLRASGFAPLEGVGIRIFGRLTAGTRPAQAAAELTGLVVREAAVSPETHGPLRPVVRAYGGSSIGPSVQLAMTHGPILLVLIVASMSVATLFFARTATRDAEISVRYALGASRARIVGQLFVEAFVLAAAAAAVGLAAAHWALKWGTDFFYLGTASEMPFWLHRGLRVATLPYAAVLTVVGAAILGVLPALKATGSHVQSQLKNLGAGGSTLRVGRLWTAATIVQVSLTVICLLPAIGITEEAVRDPIIKARFPGEQYLAVRVDLDREAGAVPGVEEPASTFARRMDQIVEELQRRVAREPGVLAATFANGLPGADAFPRRAQLEIVPGAPTIAIANLWTFAVGPGFFEAFERPIVFGRDFHEGDRTADARTAIVNEAFARRFLNGGNPVGTRVRFASERAGQTPEPWFEIVGMVRDIGLTPTDAGEAWHVYHAASAAAISRPVLGVHVAGDAAALAPRVRAIAAELNPGLRLGVPRPLDELSWNADLPNLAIAGAFIVIVSLGLILSAAGIFSLMSVSVSRRTREIGLRLALGASPARLLGRIFARAAVLVGTGIAAANIVLVLALTFGADSLSAAFVARTLLTTSGVMIAAVLLGCIAPARRALRIPPSEALKAT